MPRASGVEFTATFEDYVAGALLLTGGWASRRLTSILYTNGDGGAL